MMEYMVTYKNGFNGSVDYCQDHTTAIQTALRAHDCGWIPDEVYRLNPETGKYDILVGRFSVSAKDA